MPTQTTYRGVTLQRERAGHTNVFSATGGFVGGYTTEADARRAVDGMLDRPRVERVGPNQYRVIPNEEASA